MYRAWIHAWKAKLPPQGSCVNSAQSFPCLCFPHRISHHPTQGGKVCQRSFSLWTAVGSSVALRACPWPTHPPLQTQQGQRGHQERLGCLRNGCTKGWASAQGCYPPTAQVEGTSGDQKFQGHWQPLKWPEEKKIWEIFQSYKDLMIDPLRAWGRQMCWLVVWDAGGVEGEDSKEGSDWAHKGNQKLTWAPSWGPGWWWVHGDLQCATSSVLQRGQLYN